MEKKRVAFYTLGCKVNQYETNGMIQKFIDAGYTIDNAANNEKVFEMKEQEKETTNE